MFAKHYFLDDPLYERAIKLAEAKHRFMSKLHPFSYSQQKPELVFGRIFLDKKAILSFYALKSKFAPWEGVDSLIKTFWRGSYLSNQEKVAQCRWTIQWMTQEGLCHGLKVGGNNDSKRKRDEEFYAFQKMETLEYWIRIHRCGLPNFTNSQW